ncbi:MAG: DNA gyrase inhibitor YacG [Pseudomonadales bacterium]|nr:DNA gyrase inhibitor YacG [Pseudomonadales bacterium]
MAEIVQCPNCGTEVPWSTDNEYRPFCSKRCQLIDFGEWADGNRSIPSDADHDDVSASDLDKD